MSDWFDDDAFWDGIHDVLFPDERFETAEQEIEDLLALVDYRGPSVLDLCCGPGRHALVLARRGFRVTAVDRTARLVDRGRARAHELDLEIDWRVEDMREHRRPRAYHLALNLFTSFGYFADPADDERVLQNLHESLLPGGTVLLEMISKDWLMENFRTADVEDGPGGLVRVQRREIVDDGNRMNNEWILIRDGRARSYHFSHRLFDGPALERLLTRAGFGPVRLYGDHDGRPYGADAQRLIAVASRDD